VTGAADDDPSGIGTYSQAGAQLGFAIGWTMLLTYPLMAAIQPDVRAMLKVKLRRTADCVVAASVMARAATRWVPYCLVSMTPRASSIMSDSHRPFLMPSAAR
jgi:Mn2+/Fe2+ NRAMP family transporter